MKSNSQIWNSEEIQNCESNLYINLCTVASNVKVYYCIFDWVRKLAVYKTRLKGVRDMKKLFMQIVKFGFVGAFCFVIDFGLFNGLNFLGVHYLISGAVGFIVSVIVNYILSFKFVFERKEDLDRRAEFIIFVVLSAIGLGVNELFIWLSMDVIYANSPFLQNLMGEKLAAAGGKIFATAVVMVYNFVTRKIFLEKKSK